MQPRPDPRRRLILAHVEQVAGRLDGDPIDTGAFKFVVLNPTDSINLIRNPISETGRPYLDGIEYMIFVGASAAFDP